MVQTFTIESILRGKHRKAIAWDVLCNFTELAQSVKALNRIDVLSLSELEGRSQWFMMLDGAPFRWVQRDSFDKKNWEFRFRSLDGDFESLSGTWRIDDIIGEGIRLRAEISFDLGIPVLELALGDELRKRMQAFADAILDSVRNRLEPLQREERTIPRTQILSYGSINVNGEAIRAYVINVSTSGMMVCDARNLPCGEAVLSLGGSTIPSILFSNGCGPRSNRFIFNAPISATDVERIAEEIKSTASRGHARVLIERKGNLIFVDRSIPLTVVNLSPGGMLIRWEGKEQSIEEPFQICSILVIPQRVTPGMEPGTARIEFERPLTELQFETLSSRLRSDQSEDNSMMVCETIAAGSYGGQVVKNFGHLKLVTRGE